MSLVRILALVQKEWKEITRDRMYLSLAFVLPTMMMLLFGYAMSQDVENVKLAILDQDRSSLSREYVQHFTTGKYFRYIGDLPSMRAAEAGLERGEIKAVIVIPERFQERLKQGLPVSVQSIIDGSNTLSVRTIRSYIEAMSGMASADLQSKYFAKKFHLSPARTASLLQPLAVQVRYLYNEEVKQIWMMAPELILMIVMWAMPMLMALSVVREKETGSIYNINSSTITRAEFLAGKLLPVVGICIVNGLILWAIAIYYFHAPFRGSPLLFGGAMGLFILDSISLGLLASVFVKTQQAALMLMIILGATIATRYSGMFFPLAEMDKSSQFIASMFPASYFNTIVEGSFLKGASWQELRGSFMALLAYPAISLAVAHLMFRKVAAQ